MLQKFGGDKGLPVSAPPIDSQQAIVAESEAEQALVNANKQLIERFEAKTKAVISHEWGDVKEYCRRNNYLLKKPQQ